MISIKRLCKNVNICDKEFIRKAYIDCMKHKKANRRDIVPFMRAHPTEDDVVDYIHEKLVTRDLDLPPIRYREKYDTGKIRRIGIQNIESQIYDYIAVNALEEVFASIGYWQCASIKGRGPIKAMRHVKRLMGEKDCKYFFKADVRKFFDSVDHDMLLGLLNKKIKNPDLMWLLTELIRQFDGGLSIGSYLSQWLANWLMSFLYHNLENCHLIRNSKRTGCSRRSVVTGMCFYMDDFIVFTNSKKGLKEIRKVVDDTLRDLKLELKNEPHIGRSKTGCIDFVGYKIRSDYITIRSRDFIKARRAYKSFAKHPTPHQARRCIAYYGFFVNSNSLKCRKKYNIDQLTAKAKRMVSHQCRTAEKQLAISQE